MQIWLVVIFTGLRKSAGPAWPDPVTTRPGPARFLEEIFKPGPARNELGRDGPPGPCRALAETTATYENRNQSPPDPK